MWRREQYIFQGASFRERQPGIIASYGENDLGNEDSDPSRFRFSGQISMAGKYPMGDMHDDAGDANIEHVVIDTRSVLRFVKRYCKAHSGHARRVEYYFHLIKHDENSWFGVGTYFGIENKARGTCECLLTRVDTGFGTFEHARELMERHGLDERIMA